MYAIEYGRRARGEGVDLGGLRDVHAHGQRFHAEGARRLLGVRQVDFIYIRKRDVHALACEREGHRAPEPRCRAGDDGDLTAERFHDRAG